MRGRSSGKTGPPVPGLTRVGGGAIDNILSYLIRVQDKIRDTESCNVVKPNNLILSYQGTR